MPGGVCAVLDYDVEVMAEYVADMAIRVVTPEATVTPGFRKFVSQILTSTRLPSTTILLGMNYLAKRINSMKTQGAYTATEGQVWRYLTVSLLLGSKFLDDNTFQNRSWSEVSGISVSELNALEFDWVQSMSWRLYVNLDLSKDYQAWLENWKEWQQNKKRQLQASRERATPRIPAINTEVGRYHDGRHSSYSRYVKDQAAEIERYQTGKVHQHGSYHSRDSAWSSNAWSAPLTPPDSGYGTPESYGMSAVSSNAHYNDWFSQAAAQYNGRFHQAPARNPFYSSRPPAYSAHGYTYNQHQNIWEHGMAECNCPSCAGPLKDGPYFTSHGYGQPVMG